MTVSGSGFTPGGYQGSLFWDGALQKSFNIPNGGSFSTGFTIPGGASAGNHTIIVCASSGGSCYGGEFEQSASATFNVEIAGETPIPPTAAPTFNVQPAGIEVTQGIRQDFPSRNASGDLVLTPDTWVHVSGRRTIVRVYPLLVQGPTTQVTARLYGQRDGADLPGSPLSPEQPNVIPRSGDTLDSMRRDTAKTWIFVLPDSWTEEGSIYLTATVNPSGPAHVQECPGCDSDNTAYLGGVQFETLQQKDVWIQVIRTDWYWRDASGAITHDRAEISEIFNMLLYWEKVWPLDESKVRLYPIRIFPISHGDADPPITDPPNWDNQVFHDVFGYLYAPPQGRNDRPAYSTDPYVYVPTTFDPDSAIIGCSGVAGIGYPPLFHTGACWAASQEAGHSIGLNHASNAHGERSGGPVDPGYPGPHGEIEPDAFGFDIYSLEVIPPDTSCEGHTHDFMSYGCWTKWTSVYSWNKIVDAFHAENERAQLETPANSGAQLISNRFAAERDGMRVGGTHLADGRISLSPIMRLSGDLPDYPEPTSDYQLVVRDAQGDELYRSPFTPIEQTHSEEGVFDFYKLVPYMEGAAVIEIEQNGTLLGSLEASDNVPTVEIASPTSGGTWAAGQPFSVSWHGDDADGDKLYYRIELQQDGSQGWRPIYGDTTMDEVTLDPSLLPGYGGSWNLRVQVSDGFHTAMDQVGPITIEAQPPQVFVIQPTDGRVYPSSAPLRLRGDATDLADGPLPTDSLVWLIDGDEVGRGLEIEADSLAEGEHEIVLQAVNSAGISGQASATVTIDRDSDSDGMTNGWEEDNGLAPLNPSDALLDADDDGLTNLQEFHFLSDPNAVNSDGDPKSDAEELADGTDPNDPESYARHEHEGINPGGSIHDSGELALSGEPAEFQSSGQPTAASEETVQPSASEEPAARPSAGVSLLYFAGLGLIALIILGSGIALVVFLRRRST